MFDEKIVLDWDKEADMMYVLREGYDSDGLTNVDSKKVPGIVKRMHPESGECVGFIIHSFSRIYGNYVKCSQEELENLMRISLALSNETYLANTA